MNIKPDSVLLVFLLIFASFPCLGQNDNPSLRLNLGYRSAQFTDPNVTPLRYKTNEALLQLGFYRKKSGCLWDINLQGSFGTMKTPDLAGRKVKFIEYDINGNAQKVTEASLDNFTNLNLQSGLAYLLKTHIVKSEKADLYMGGSVNEHFDLPNAITLAGLYNAATFNLDWALITPLSSKGSLSSRISVPVLGYISVLPYHTTPNYPDASSIGSFFREGTSFSSLNKFQSITYELRYDYNTGKRWSLGIFYRFFWMRIPKNHEVMHTFSNAATVSVIYNLNLSKNKQENNKEKKDKQNNNNEKHE